MLHPICLLFLKPLLHLFPACYNGTQVYLHLHCFLLVWFLSFPSGNGIIQQFIDHTVEERTSRNIYYRQKHCCITRAGYCTLTISFILTWESNLHLCVGIMNDRSIRGHLVPPDALVSRREADHVQIGHLIPAGTLTGSPGFDVD